MGKKLVALSEVRPLTCHMYPFFKTAIKNFFKRSYDVRKTLWGLDLMQLCAATSFMASFLIPFLQTNQQQKNIHMPHTNNHLVCSSIRNKVKNLTIISIFTGSNCSLWCLGVMCNIWHGPNYVYDLSGEVEQIVVFDYRSMSVFFHIPHHPPQRCS